MIEHVLLDADGVLQDVPGGWVSTLTPYLGERAESFIRESWADELPSLRGEVDFLELLAAQLRRHRLDVSAADLHAAVWCSIEVLPSSIELVHQLRAAGYGVHLGTNQERHRAAFMRTQLGYDDLFDVSCYSCDLGATKTDPAYFTQAVELIGADPASVLFVDDTEPNVQCARGAGLAAEQWHFERGEADIRSLLAAHGVRLAG